MSFITLKQEMRKSTLMAFWIFMQLGLNTVPAETKRRTNFVLTSMRLGSLAFLSLSHMVSRVR